MSLHLLILLFLLKYMSIIHSNAEIMGLSKACRINEEWIRSSELREKTKVEGHS